MSRQRLSDQIAQEIKARILSGAYTQGSRLPPIPELAAEFGVTRLTLREALQRTEAAGFTESRQGDGTRVRNLQDADLAILTEILRAGRSFRPEETASLLEFRSVVSLGFVDAIVRNATASHTAALRAIVARERANLGDRESIVLSDCEFHEELASASGNIVYALLVRSVRPAYLHLCRIVFGALHDLAGVVDAHEAMAQALEARNAEALREVFGSFVACGNEIIEQSMKQDSAGVDPVHCVCLEGGLHES